MTSTLIDTDVLLDLLGGGEHAAWSARAMEMAFVSGTIVLSPIVWSELGGMSKAARTLDNALSRLRPVREHLSFDAAFRAGTAHAAYRRQGGNRERTLPDFLIGAHAETSGHVLLTRDPKRYRAYFPDLDIIAPDTHP